MRCRNLRFTNISLIIILFLTIFSLFFHESEVLAYHNIENNLSSVLRPSSQSANLVINGNFESGNLNNWSIEDSVSAISGAGYNNSYAAQINSWGRITQFVATTAGKKYDVTAWVRVNRQIKAPGWGGVRVQITDYSWQELGASPFYTNASSQWISVRFSFTAASNQTRIAFENFSDTGEFDAVFDEATIRLSGSITPPPTTPPVTATPTRAATATATTTPIAPSSLITNGSFETGSLSSWEDYGGMTVMSTAAFAGSYGARMHETGRLDQPFSTIPGQGYLVQAKLRLEQQSVAPTWGGLQFLITNSSWQTLATSAAYSSSTAPTNQWVDISFSFTANSNTSRLIFQNFSNGKFIASMDELIISGASTATATSVATTATATATNVAATATATSIATQTNTPLVATPTSVIIPTASPTPASNPESSSALESFEGSASTWLVSSWSSGSGTIQRSTTTAADGQASVLLSTNGSPARAQLQVSFSNSASSHTWDERPGTWNWQRAMVYVPSSTVAQLQRDQYFTLAGLYPSTGGSYGWYLRVTPAGQLSVFGYTANGAPATFPIYGQLPLDRWVSLELGLHTQAGPGVKRSFALLVDGDFYGWYRQGNMGSETYNRAAFGILNTSSSAPLQVFIDAWQQPGTTAFPTGPDLRSTAALQTHDFRSTSGVQVQYDWSTWALQPTLHAQVGLFSAADRIQAGHTLDRMPDLRSGWAEIELDWAQGPPALLTPLGYFGPMVGFRKEINREQNLEVIPIGNGDGSVDLALEAWVGAPVILARWPMPIASSGASAIPQPGDIIRVRWEELNASTLNVRASYYDASSATWHTNIINGSYTLTAISDGTVTVNFMDGYHTASSVTIDSPAYAIRRYTVGTLATYP